MAAGDLSALDAWPEYFTGPDVDEEFVPALDTDNSGFEWEGATPESFAGDMAALEEAMGQNARLSIAEPVPPPVTRPPLKTPEDLEWT